jgi:hypothetical protein
MVHALRRQRILERTHDVLLPDQLGEQLRTPFAGEGESVHFKIEE